MKVNTKKKLFHISLLLTFVILFSMALAIQKSIAVMNKSVEFMGYEIENNERDKISDDLVRYASAVENDINSHNYGQSIPTSVFKKYMNVFADRRSISNISIINVGYTFDEGDTNTMINDVCKQLPDKYHGEVEDILKDMIVKLKNNENGTDATNTSVNELLDDATDKIVTLTHVNRQSVQNIMFKELFVTNKLVMSTNDNKTQISDTELDQVLSNDSSWNEWIAIPKGYLGINDEASVDRGKPNFNYNKYIILVSLDRSVIMSNFDKLKLRTDNISITLLVVLVLTSILALSLCAIQFYKKINGGGEIEPIIRTDSSVDDDATYKLFHSFNRKPK